MIYLGFEDFEEKFTEGLAEYKEFASAEELSYDPTTSHGSSANVTENENAYCVTEVWGCMSGMMEETVKHLHKPVDILR